MTSDHDKARHGPGLGPLNGVTILDLSRVLAGPYATMVLNDLGARVIKIERPAADDDPGGDDSRHYGPFIENDSAYFMSLNRGKESIALDLKDDTDRAIFDKLLTRADVLVENFRPGVMEKLGYGWEKLHAEHPRLIYAACSGFGQTGPYAKRAAYDMVVQAMGGIMSITGTPDGPPVRVGTSIGDITAGLFTAVGINAALFERSKTGLGQFVDVAMLDCQVAILENAIARYSALREVPGPLGARHPTITPFAAFKAQDAYVVVAAGNDGLFARTAQVLGRPDLPSDPRFNSNRARNENIEALNEIIEACLAERPVAEWLEALLAAGVPCGPINNVADLFTDPHIKARNMLVDMDHPRHGPVTMPGNPIKLSGSPDRHERASAPDLDTDRADILAEFGDGNAE